MYLVFIYLLYYFIMCEALSECSRHIATLYHVMSEHVDGDNAVTSTGPM